MKKILSITMVSLMVWASIFGAVMAFANEEDVWEQIESTYYCETSTSAEKDIKNELGNNIIEKSSKSSERFDVSEKNIQYELDYDTLDIGILGGGTVDPSSTTEFYISRMNFYNKESIKEFKQIVQDEGLFSTLEFDNEYWTVAKRDQDSRPSTAMIRNGKIAQLTIENNGERYKINLDTALKDKLSSSNLDLTKTEAYFVLLIGLAETIVFDDGENQLIQIKGSCQDFMDEGSIITIDELFLIIDENIDDLTFSYDFIIEDQIEEKTIEYGG